MNMNECELSYYLRSLNTISTITGNANGQWLLFRRGRPTNNLLNLTANYLANFSNDSRAASYRFVRRSGHSRECSSLARIPATPLAKSFVFLHDFASITFDSLSHILARHLFDKIKQPATKPLLIGSQAIL